MQPFNIEINIPAHFTLTGRPDAFVTVTGVVDSNKIPLIHSVNFSGEMAGHIALWDLRTGHDLIEFIRYRIIEHVYPEDIAQPQCDSAVEEVNEILSK
jgi:hypothetical protein